MANPPLKPSAGGSGLPNRWVVPPPRKTLVVGVADMIASNDVTAMIVTHSLGSCIAAVVYDPACHAGGLLHLMLPDSGIDSARADQSPFMFADSGLPRLFHSVYGLGGIKNRLVVKLAGGAQFLDEKKIWNIGERNLAAVEAMLAKNNVSVAARDVGGRAVRTVRLDLANGRLTVQTVGREPYDL